MKTRTILAVGAVVAVAGGLTAAALTGNSAQDAATYAATHPVVGALDDTIPCAKCEKRARDTSPVLVEVGPAASQEADR